MLQRVFFRCRDNELDVRRHIRWEPCHVRSNAFKLIYRIDKDDRFGWYLAKPRLKLACDKFWGSRQFIIGCIFLAYLADNMPNDRDMISSICCRSDIVLNSESIFVSSCISMC